MYLLPKKISSIKVPPLKIQGIKTKLVPFIAENISWQGDGVWFEPFMGSGVVGFNIQPKRAVFSDSNPHIIRLYKDIQSGVITPYKTRLFLEAEAPKLATSPADKESYYYEVRKRFNESPNSLDFIFLQRSNFNGMIRFGPNGYNVPFGRKPERFRPALITKIVNQVAWIERLLKGKDWDFVNCEWKEVVSQAKTMDFVYLDPPYIGRSTDYFNSWEDDDANDLANTIQMLPCGYALSMWYKNKYRVNDHLSVWNGEMLTNEHFYFLGGKENNRNEIIEALIIKKGFVPKIGQALNAEPEYLQVSLFS